MKRTLLLGLLAALPGTASWAQPRTPQIEGTEVFRNDDVVFHEIDAHTWVGSGHEMASESLYLVEGNDKAVLIDAGTRIARLDEVVAEITDKPVMLVVTHAHPDHTGSAGYFPKLHVNPGDVASPFLAEYEGEVEELRDGQILDLGGRELKVVFTPAHTPGSTTFVDEAAGYGFSGDSFGSGNLLLFGTFSTLLATCEKTSALMEEHGIEHLYPGHYFGENVETRQRIEDLASISRDVLSGRAKGEPNPRARFGLDRVIEAHGVRVNFGEASVR